jgi:hypothetical protein
VDVSDPPTAYVVEWWPAWRVNDLIVLQRPVAVRRGQGDWPRNPQAAKFSLDNPYAAIPDREEDTQGMSQDRNLSSPEDRVKIRLC